MAWRNNWSGKRQGMGPRYPPPMANVHPAAPSAPVANYGATNTDQYNQWQWQQYQQQYAQWYAMYGEKYAQQTGSTLPPVASPMPQAAPNVATNLYTPAPLPGHTLPHVATPMPQVAPNVATNPYAAAPLPVGPAFGSMSMVAPPPPSEPHPDELQMSRTGEIPPPPEEKSPEEIAFDEQFRKWEQEFEMWKKTNINHPDKAAYREYEQKYEEQRKKLLDHREQLRRRKNGAQNATGQGPRNATLVPSLQKPPPPPPQSSQPPPPPQPAQNLQPPQPPEEPTEEESSSYLMPTDGNTQRENSDMHLENLFSSSGKDAHAGAIPGLDLIDDAPPPVAKKAKLEEPVIDLSNDEEEVKQSVTNSNANRNMISTLLNDPNVNALLQLVGKTISGNGAGVGAGDTSNPLVAALAQLTSNSNLEKKNPGERSPNEMNESTVRHSNTSRTFDSHIGGPNDQGLLPSTSGTLPHNTMLREERLLPRNKPQEFNPRIPPPLLDVDFTRPPPSIRSTAKSQRDRFGCNLDPSFENGSFNDGYLGDGGPAAKMPRFDLGPPTQVPVPHHKEYEVDPELGRPVAVPKPDWMSEEEYQEIYDRYEHVQSFEERKSKMLLAIQVLKQSEIRIGALVVDEPTPRSVAGMPKPMAPVKELIKSEPVDDYFKPQQVFDYSNCRSVGAVTSHPLPAGRVIDYGHRGTTQHSMNNNNNRFNSSRRDEFHAREGTENGFGSNTQRFDYNHSRVASNVGPAVSMQQNKTWPQTNSPASHDRIVSGLERLAQMHLNPNPEESNPNYPSKFLLMNDNRPNCLSTKRAKRPSSIRKQKLKQLQQQQQAQEKQQEQEVVQQQQAEQNEEPSLNAVICKQEPELLLEDLSSDEDIGPDDSFASQSNDESAKPSAVKQEPPDERSESTVSSLSSQNHTATRMVDIDDLLLPPGRFHRPPRICLLIRGLPGSGKSHLARLIKNKEQTFGQSPRVLSLDDYFLVEREEEEKDPVSGKVIKLTRAEYEYDAEMEDIYIQNLVKAFKRTISERLFNLVIVDCCNHRLETYCEFHNYARSNGFKVYTCTMQTDVRDCVRQNIHKRTEQEIQAYADNWALAPEEHVQINFNSLLEPELPADTDTTVADMELAAVDEERPNVEEGRAQTEQTSTSHDESNDSPVEGSAECDMFASKWDHDTSEQNLARLDGISKRLKRPTTLEDYLQLDDTNSEDQENEAQDGVNSGGKKKRVRWADVEERKAQEKMRQLGFVVGVTDWRRMMDPSEGSSALTQTKYIARVKRQQ